MSSVVIILSASLHLDLTGAHQGRIRFDLVLVPQAAQAVGAGGGGDIVGTEQIGGAATRWHPDEQQQRYAHDAHE